MRPNRSRPDCLRESVQQRRPAGVNPLAGPVGPEPLSPVDLGEAPSAPRAWRPLHLELVADDGGGVQIAGHGPRLNELARLLADLAELGKVPVRRRRAE